MKGQGFSQTKKRYDAAFKKESIRLADTVMFGLADNMEALCII